jgi:DNA-binding MarR family transcriptional regulator
MGEHPVSDGQIDAMMRASRVLVAVMAKSLAEVEDVVTPAQLRVLVLIASRGPQTLGAVAEDLGVHASNATRACDRLSAAKLIRRDDDPKDRRFLQLRLTEEGMKLVSGMMAHRRAALAEVLSRMPGPEREELERVMTSFAEAAGETHSEVMPAALGLTFEGSRKR